MKRTIMSMLSAIILIFTGLSCVFFIGPEEGSVLAQSGDAPDFTVIDTYNNSFTLSNHRGEVIVLNFFSIPSMSCRVVMEEMRTVYEQKGSEIIMISIDVLHDDTEEQIEEYRTSNGYEWRFARDTDELILKYSVNTVPKTCIIDTNGDISYSEEGLVESETILEEVDKAFVPIGGFFQVMCVIISICAIIGVILVIIIIRTGQGSRTSESLGQTTDSDQKYPCSTCGQPLAYIEEHQRWYCNNCKKYV